MKLIALINLSSIPTLKVRSVFPIGLACLATYLEEHGHQVDIVDFLQDDESFTNLDFIEKDYDFIGLSIRNMEIDTIGGESYFPTYNNLIKRIKSKIVTGGFKTTLFFGGAGYSVFHSEIDHELFDEVSIVGNGERLILELIEGNINQKGKYVNNSNEFFRTLDIKYDHKLVKSYIQQGSKEFGLDEIGVPTHRGQCVQNCIYCAYKNIESEANVYRDIKLVEKNIVALYEIGVRKIFFCDSLFNEKLEYAKAICRMICSLELADLTWKAYFSMNIDTEFLQLLKKSRCGGIYISFDTFSEKMIHSMQKDFKPERAVQLIQDIRQVDIPLRIFILFGGPGECRETIKETCDFINKYLEKDEVLISLGVRVLPQSGIEALVEEKTNLLDLTFYPVGRDFVECIIKYLNKEKINFDNFWRLVLIQQNLLKN